MQRVVKIFKTLRNNWKKTVVGTYALVYGVQYGISSYDCRQMMRAYCESAKKFGEVPIPVDTVPRQVTVILNPAANRKKAKKEFEEYCAPLLHLAGLSVNLLVTGKEGQARTLTEKLEGATDAIVVAGGDGTLSEAITGILRREDGVKITRKLPFGVLPLGKTNSIAKQLFPDCENDRIKLMAEATMAVIQEATKSLDVIKFEGMPVQEGGKPVYGLVGMHWGAFRDAQTRRDKYWYFGGLRGFASYLFTGLKSEKDGITWRVEAKMEYSPPCGGCSLCFNHRIDLLPDQTQRRSWWRAFGNRQPGLSNPVVDYRQIINNECGKSDAVDIVTTDFCLLSSNMSDDKKLPQLVVSYGPEEMSFQEFVAEGWQRENGGNPCRSNSVLAKEVKLWPAGLSQAAGQSLGKASDQETSDSSTSTQKDIERWISIDSEDYEVKAIHATVIPNAVKMFCAPNV